MSRAVILAVLLSIGSSRCASSVVGRGDAAADRSVDASAIDGGSIDADPGVFRFAHCTRASDCSGASAECLTEFPGGLCSQPCTDDSQCAGGVCHIDRCLPRCTPGGGECAAWGGACGGDGPRRPDVRMCTPSCFPSGSEPTGEPSCVEGTVCDCALGSCVLPSLAHRDVTVGGPCTSHFDCAGGECFPEIDSSGEPTGYLGGYCLSGGARRPDVSMLQPGDPWPLSNCCPGGVPVLAAVDPATGDPTFCIRGCARDADCRPGYECDTTYFGTFHFSTGVCEPIDCLAGRDCPAGTHCVMLNSSGTPYGVCAQ